MPNHATQRGALELLGRALSRVRPWLQRLHARPALGRAQSSLVRNSVSTPGRSVDAAARPVDRFSAVRLVDRFSATRLVERSSAARRVVVDVAAPRSRLGFPPPSPIVAHRARMRLADPVRQNVSPARPPGLAHPAAWGPPAPAATRRVRSGRHANRHGKAFSDTQTVMAASQNPPTASQRHVVERSGASRGLTSGSVVTRHGIRYVPVRHGTEHVP